MRPRHTALLTPLESAVPISILISILNAPITSLESALTSHSQLIENTATLSLAESALTDFSPATPLESALTKNIGGGGLLFRFRNSSLATHLSPLYSSSFFSHSCALFCTFSHSPKTQPSYFQSLAHSLPKNPRGWVHHLSPQVSPRTNRIRSRQSGPLFHPHQSPITSHGLPIPLSPTAQTTTPSRMYIVPVLSSPLCIRGIALSFRVGGYHE